MDQIAVTDFNGAMENWGCIIYQESALLLSKETVSAAQRKLMAVSHQHELAHQWFGNYVTMKFWDELWLNEGFATWMSSFSCNVLHPKWNTWHAFIGESQAPALKLDSLRNSNPVQVPVKNVSEISQIFSAISYQKGSCLIRMISSYMGEEVFMAGIRLYLKRHAYGNTESSDLWKALGEVSGKDVASIMDTWIRKVGYPFLTVIETQSGIKIKQNRFLQSADATAEENKTIYPVLIALQTKVGKQNLLLNQRSMDIELNDLEFFKLNSGQSGFYRVLYAPDRLCKLGKAIAAGLLAVEDRIGIIADAAALSSSGYQRTSALLGLLSNLDVENSSYVWKCIDAALMSLERAWAFEPMQIQKELRHFKKMLFSPRAEEIGWKFSGDDDISLQEYKAVMFRSAGLAGNEEFVNHPSRPYIKIEALTDARIVTAAKRMFRTRYYDGDRSALHPSLGQAVNAIVLPEGNSEDYDIIQKIFRTADDADERREALRSLGFFHNPDLLHATLNLILSSEVKSQDVSLPLAGLMQSSITSVRCWEWCKRNLEALLSKIGDHFGGGGGLVALLVTGIPTQEHLEDVQAFFDDRDTQPYDRQLAQGLDELRVKIKWVRRDREDVKAWLDERKSMACRVRINFGDMHVSEDTSE
ncbi:MAG: Aminopeptidase 2 mitochondrial [Claussenomyces sp. TS43310]|nr:MAG: Aminopeptidase 2 mitochondrial [Claussenomyces sp. TS43310]